MFDKAASPIGGLNPAQRVAVTHGEGPLLVVAGAGTGKTKTLACRVAHLIQRGVAPERVLLLTFTRRAAKEMLDRAGRHTSRAIAAKVWGGTFHAVANRLLRIYGQSLGLPAQFTVMDQTDTTDLFGIVRRSLDATDKGQRRPKKETLAAIYSRTANSQMPLSEVLTTFYPWCVEETDTIRAIFQDYAARKRERGLLDFDDLLLLWRALAVAPGAGQVVGDLFEHILVDEYQDTNGLQADILRAMRSRCSNITAVGDDAQAIYSFRSATVRNILEFPDHFPGAAIVKLEQNYRSTQPLLDASNAVVAASVRRYHKYLFTARTGGARPALVTCVDEAQQSDAVCDRILEQRERGLLLRQQAVLFRAGHHSSHLEIELARRNIPFVKYGGLRFLEAAHVKDMLAFLRILENPRDELAWFRVLGLIDGIGAATTTRVLTELGVTRSGGQSGARRREPLAALIDGPLSVPRPACEQMDEFRAAVADCVRGELGPASEMERIRRWCDPVLERRYDNAQVRKQDLDQLQGIAAGYSSRGRFIVDLTLDPPASTGDYAGPPLLDDDYLILSTIHSAKGCEWEAVHLIHAADGMIPSDMATGSEDEIEEERRLLYVALTRAKDSLCVYWPLRYYHRPPGLGDAHSYAQLTRFLAAGPRSCFDEEVEAPARESDAEVSGVDAGASVDELLGRLWSA